MPPLVHSPVQRFPEEIRDDKPANPRFDSLDLKSEISYQELVAGSLDTPGLEGAKSDTMAKGEVSKETLKDLVREILREERQELKNQANGADGIDAITSQILTTLVTDLKKKVSLLDQPDKKDAPSAPEAKQDDEDPDFVVSRLMKETSTSKAVPDVESAAGDGHGSINAKSILTVVRDVSKGNQRTLEIRSPLIIGLLRKIVDYYPGQALGADRVSFQEPYMLLFHYRHTLTKALEDEDLDEETKKQLEHLLRFLRKASPDVSLELDALEKDKERNIISFANSWLIFAPGTIVYSSQELDEKDENDKAKVVVSSNAEGGERAYMVEEISGLDVEKLPSGREVRTPLKLRCWSIDFDGYRFGRTYTELFVREFNGSREITDLEVVPHRYADPEIGPRLIERGRLFWKLKDKDTMFRLYTGRAWSKTSMADTLRVVVDHASYSKSGEDGIQIEGVQVNTDHQHCGCSECQEKRQTAKLNFERLDRVSKYAKYNSVEPATEPDETMLLLCPNRAYAFSLRDKTWKPVKLGELKQVEFRRSTFDRLVMKKEYKDTVRALVSTYTSDKLKFRDLVEGKGQGLVLLLHGPPGTGKTLMAECVADEYERPLYAVTCGDLGTDPWQLEWNLRRIFKDATTWNAVLLLDEADIFLQQRDYVNIKRNALVSIFLRELEYFDGILFLTTNRIGSIDEAFQSRIHVQLGLPVLDADTRKDIWKVFIRELKGIHKESRKDLVKHVNSNLADIKMNGRQIRNCVRTALALANEANEPMSYKHLDAVVKMGVEFDSYMQKLHKMGAEEYQGNLGNRLPNWTPGS